MFKLFALAGIAGLTLMAQAPPTLAQGRDLAERLLLAHNQLGLLEYCEAQTHIGPEAVGYQRRLLGLIPVLVHPDRAAEARAAGQAGQMIHKGQARALPSALVEVEALARFCQDMAQNLVPEGTLPPASLEIRGGFPPPR